MPTVNLTGILSEAGRISSVAIPLGEHMSVFDIMAGHMNPG
jgi:hypothetical protein